MASGSGFSDHNHHAAPVRRLSAIIWREVVCPVGRKALHHHREFWRLRSVHHLQLWREARRNLRLALDAWATMRTLEAPR